MEITNFLSPDNIITFTMSLVIVELIVGFTKNIRHVKKIKTKYYTYLVAVLHLLISNTEVCIFPWSLIGVYTLFINALIVTVLLTNGYNVAIGKINVVKTDKRK